MKLTRRTFAIAGSAVLVSAPRGSNAQKAPGGEKKYDSGASDTEIRLGHFCPYTGPAAPYGVIGKAHEAYWKSVNDAGGINGRKVTFVSRDDGYDPKRSLEVTRSLVEEDKVLALYNPLGTDNNTAIRPYMNERKVPQLYVSSGASKWGNPKQFPWTIGFQPDYRFEAAAYVKHALKANKNAKFGLVRQNDEFGQDYELGVLDVLKNPTDRLAVVNYDVGAETLAPQIEKLKEFGANVLINVSTPKYSVEVIRKVAELKWKPIHYLTNVALSDAAVIRPAGRENCQGIITAAYMKDPVNPVWDNDLEMQAWRRWMAKYLPDADNKDIYNAFAYSVSSLMKETLRRCGNTLTRENLMKQAASLSFVRIPMLLPNIYVRTAPDVYYPVQDVQLSQYTGQVWKPLQGYMRNPRTFAEPTDDVAASTISSVGKPASEAVVAPAPVPTKLQ